MKDERNTRKGLKVLVLSLMVILILALFLVIVYFNADISSKSPEKMEEGIEITEYEYQQRKVFCLVPEGKIDYTILYVHGGSYLGELTQEHWDFCKKIAKDTSAAVVIPDYPLAPKYDYQDVFSMMIPFYQELIQKINIEHLIVMGDSAGGGLVLALMETMGEQSSPMPQKTILLSPWLDVTMTNPEISEIEKNDTELNRASLILAGNLYAGKEGLTSYLVNPINGPLENLKNVTIYTGTYDMLNPDAHLLVEKASKVGVNIELRETAKATHIWMLKQENPLAKQTYEDIVSLIKQ